MGPIAARSRPISIPLRIGQLFQASRNRRGMVGNRADRFAGSPILLNDVRTTVARTDPFDAAARAASLPASRKGDT